MAALALVLYVVWFMLAFVVRGLLQKRRTGDAGFRGVSDPRSTEAVVGLLFFVALVAGVAAPIAGLLGLDAVPSLDATAVRLSGLVVACGGIVAPFVAQLSMGESWRVGVDPGERTELVTDGAFNIVRNPIFSAMLVTAVGLALMVPNWFALAGAAALVGALELQVRIVEEPYLRAVHGAAYRSYERRVGRFVPFLGR